MIGNPPYILLQDQFVDEHQLEYLRSKYSTASYKVDTYHLFMERGIELARESGRFSMITPANFLTNNYLAGLRRFILQRSVIDHITVIDKGVFQGISVDNAVFVFLVRKRVEDTFPVIRVAVEADHLVETARGEVSYENALQSVHVLFTGNSHSDLSNVLDRITNENRTLGDFAYVNFGKQLRNRKVYLEDVITVESLDDIGSAYKPCYTGRDVNRYMVNWKGLACLDDEIAKAGGCWDPERQNAQGKLLTRQIGATPVFGLDENGYQCLNTMFMINMSNDALDPLVLLGILNSKLLKAYWTDRFYDRRRTFPKIKGTYLKLLPISFTDTATESQNARYSQLSSLTRRMNKLHEKLVQTKTNYDHTVFQHQIDATDRQIDQLVYELYGLTDEEIAVVEASTA